jgi:uncharacterized protein YbjQ (UPF0145 family)
MRQAGQTTSNLSTDEFLLVRAAGFDIRGFVMGVCFYRVASSSNVNAAGEAYEFSQAFYDARELAMSRMQAEAEALEADGIVGVDIDYVWRTATEVEFIATGTAIVAKEARERYGIDNWRNAQGKPFTSDLSCQSFYKLLRYGYLPVGVVLASCVYVAQQSVGGMFKRLGKFTEIPELTQSAYDARELAMSRMQAEVAALGGTAVVEVDLSEIGDHFTESQGLCEFYAIGTAVRRIHDTEAIGEIIPTISLDD